MCNIHLLNCVCVIFYNGKSNRKLCHNCQDYKINDFSLFDRLFSGKTIRANLFLTVPKNSVAITTNC